MCVIPPWRRSSEPSASLLVVWSIGGVGIGLRGVVWVVLVVLTLCSLCGHVVTSHLCIRAVLGRSPTVQRCSCEDDVAWNPLRCGREPPGCDGLATSLVLVRSRSMWFLIFQRSLSFHPEYIFFLGFDQQSF